MTRLMYVLWTLLPNRCPTLTLDIGDCCHHAKNHQSHLAIAYYSRRYFPFSIFGVDRNIRSEAVFFHCLGLDLTKNSADLKLPRNRRNFANSWWLWFSPLPQHSKMYMFHLLCPSSEYSSSVRCKTLLAQWHGKWALYFGDAQRAW